MKGRATLLALAIGAFGIGVTEFAPMGLLPVIAAGLKVSIPKAGLLVTGYALGVLVGAPLFTLPTGRLNRKTLLLLLMALFTIGNALAALAPTYAWLMAARIVTSFCHGAFFGVGSVVASSAVEDRRRAGAVAAMFSGLTIANIGGVPLAAFVGEHIGWRAAFAGIAGIGVLALIALQLALPSIPGGRDMDVGAELRVLGKRPMILALATTALGSAAMFTVFTYIAPILQNVTHATPLVVNEALVIYGVGLTLGNWLGGRFSDRALTPTLIVVLLSLTALLLLFAVTMRWTAPALATVFAWGVATFALVPALQTRVMRVGEAAPNLTAAINIGAFNLGNAGGAALGGAVIALGLAYGWVAVAGAATSAAALALVAFGGGGDQEAERPLDADARRDSRRDGRRDRREGAPDVVRPDAAAGAAAHGNGPGDGRGRRPEVSCGAHPLTRLAPRRRLARWGRDRRAIRRASSC